MGILSTFEIAEKSRTVRICRGADYDLLPLEDVNNLFLRGAFAFGHWTPIYVPKLRTLPLETAIAELQRRSQVSLEEA